MNRSSATSSDQHRCQALSLALKGNFFPTALLQRGWCKSFLQFCLHPDCLSCLLTKDFASSRAVVVSPDGTMHFCMHTSTASISTEVRLRERERESERSLWGPERGSHQTQIKLYQLSCSKSPSEL